VSDSDVGERAIRKPGSVRRQAINVSKEELVSAGPLAEGQTLPLLIRSAVADLNLSAWAQDNRERIEGHLREHGAVLFRGFSMRPVDEFEQFIRAIAGEPLEYRERSSPRTRIAGNIYTSTEYPADQSILLHNENSYQHTFPLRLCFHCVTPASEGGETPIADCRRVFQRLSTDLRERFERKQVMYVRNFGDGFGLSWQMVFQTEDRDEVEQFCHRARVECEWKKGDRLRTRQVRPAIAVHPRTSEKVWFNHVAFFHFTSLESSVSAALLAVFGEENLPNNTYFGDGSSIETSDLEEIRAAYAAETIRFPWQRGDVLLVDNMLVAHGRAPYAGERKILIGMAEPIHW
jgi:alpha-ketoglutarate-dependent taurine dioxygenase